MAPSRISPVLVPLLVLAALLAPRAAAQRRVEIPHAAGERWKDVRDEFAAKDLTAVFYDDHFRRVRSIDPMTTLAWQYPPGGEELDGTEEVVLVHVAAHGGEIPVPDLEGKPVWEAWEALHRQEPTDAAAAGTTWGGGFVPLIFVGGRIVRLRDGFGGHVVVEDGHYPIEGAEISPTATVGVIVEPIRDEKKKASFADAKPLQIFVLLALSCGIGLVIARAGRRERPA